MRFFELFNTDTYDNYNLGNDYSKKNMGLSDLGAVNFSPGVTDKGQNRTPHYEIDESLKMFEMNPIVGSSILQLLSFVIPNRKLKFTSEDKRSIVFLEKWASLRRGSLAEIKNIYTTKTICGNAYLEKFFHEGKFDDFRSINDASRIYVNPNDVGGAKAFIFQLPVGIKSFQYSGVTRNPTYYQVTYIKNYQWTFKQVYGFPISAENIAHYKSGWCLPFNEKIETDKGLLRIGDIVKDKLKVKIKTYNIEENKFEYKPILNWLKRPYKEDFYKIYHSSIKSKGIKCTKEHPILTKEGYKPANKITTNDYVAIKTQNLNKQQKALIYGTLLGDGSISKYHGRMYPRLSITHCKEQKYYLNWFKNSLNNLNPKIIKGIGKALSSGDTLFEHYNLTTIQSANLIDIYNNCVKKGKKIITAKWLKNITPLSLAVWIMDDGSVKWNKNLHYPMSVQLCTDSFNKEEIELLRNMLKDIYGLNSNLQKHENNNIRISIPRDSMERLEQITSPYILFNRNTRKKEWIAEDILNEEKEERIFVKIDRIERQSITTSYGSETVYDLEIADNHNFITKNVIVHNSRDNLYGRSLLASAIDANNVFMQIMSSWDTIARTRQLDKKILVPKIGNDYGQLGKLDQDTLDDLKDKLEDSEGTFTLFNFPFEATSIDIKNAGNYDLMTDVLDVCRRILMYGLLPQFLTPWSDSGTTQGSEAAVPPFKLKLKSDQNELIDFLNYEIIGELRKQYKWLAEDASFYFDEPLVLADQYYIDKMLNLVREEIITREQAKNYLVKMGVFDVELFEDSDSSDENNKKGEDSADTSDKRDDKDDSKPKEQVSELKKKIKILKESFTASSSFKLFKGRLIRKKLYKDSEVNNWTEKEVKDVGGKQVRLIYDSKDESYYIFEGLNLINTFSKDVKYSLINSFYLDHIDTLKKLWDKFETGETEEDKILAEADKQIKKVIDEDLKKVFKALQNSSRKTESFNEAFLSIKIFPKIDNIFKGINLKLNKIISDTMNKLNLRIVKGDSDGFKADDDTKKKLNDSKNLMKTNLQQQIKDTKDTMLADMKRQITNGITAGQSIDEIRQAVEKKNNYENNVEYKFKRAIRTQAALNNKILQLKKWKKMGFENVLWQTRSDSRVRETHEKMNQRVYPIDYLLKNLANGKIEQFNCRCSLVLWD